MGSALQRCFVGIYTRMRNDVYMASERNCAPMRRDGSSTTDDLALVRARAHAK